MSSFIYLICLIDPTNVIGFQYINDHYTSVGRQADSVSGCISTGDDDDGYEMLINSRVHSL